MVTLFPIAAAPVVDLIPMQILAFGALMLAAHLGSKLFNRFNLPEPAGQLLGGMLAGPWFLHATGILPASHLVYDGAIDGFTFFVFVFIAVVAFSIGEELHIDRLKHVGKSALVISITQAITTMLLITGGLFLIARRPLLESLMIGSIGIATAPAMTFVLLNKLKIEGRLRNVLGSVEVLCDIIGVVIFSLVVQIAQGMSAGHVSLRSLAVPLLRDLGMAHVVGVGVFALLWILVRRRKSMVEHPTEILAPQDGLLTRVLAEHPSPSAQVFSVVVGTVSIGAGLSYALHYPFLVTATFAGFLVANLHSRAIFDSLKISNIAALFNLGFFAIVGSTVRFDKFDSSIGFAIAVYVIARTAGKVLGTRLGCRIVGEDRKIASCLPYLVLPQAGVAAVEAVYAGAILQEPLIPAILLPSIVIFEIGGTLMSGFTLEKWRSWVAGEEAELQPAATSSKRTTDPSRDLLLSGLRPDHVMLELEADTKNGVIEAMVAHAHGLPGGGNIHEEEALQLIAEREKLFATGMGHGLAIPHCRLLGIDTPVVLWACLKTGVVFGGVDNEPCHLVIMILSSVGDPDSHMKLLGATARILGKEETRYALLAAKDVDAFIQTLTDAP
ncbi:MAG: PTS transporter subunit EIIA [Verrucomicrobia bacterium]|mgnify:FL=1|jgi:mannitol/fructose-specific phosphotransferase system IIA component (Ntr-type)/Kef-type K+ transport system membrane component KefB|nr:PTS transporter subunit EIIA [Verrucomicrobiota bacterium]